MPIQNTASEAEEHKRKRKPAEAKELQGMQQSPEARENEPKGDEEKRRAAGNDTWAEKTNKG